MSALMFRSSPAQVRMCAAEYAQRTEFEFTEVDVAVGDNATRIELRAEVLGNKIPCTSTFFLIVLPEWLCVLLLSDSA